MPLLPTKTCLHTKQTYSCCSGWIQQINWSLCMFQKRRDIGEDQRDVLERGKKGYFRSFGIFFFFRTNQTQQNKLLLRRPVSGNNQKCAPLPLPSTWTASLAAAATDVFERDASNTRWHCWRTTSRCFCNLQLANRKKRNVGVNEGGDKKMHFSFNLSTLTYLSHLIHSLFLFLECCPNNTQTHTQ